MEVIMVTIRRIRPEDTMNVLPLFHLASRHRRPLPWREFTDEFAAEHPHSLLFVAEDENRNLVGYGELHFIFTGPRGRIGRIEYVVTSEEHRRQGIAEELCRTLVEEAKKPRVMRIELRTESEGARRLYEKLGFREVEHSTVMTLEL